MLALWAWCAGAYRPSASSSDQQPARGELVGRRTSRGDHLGGRHHRPGGRVSKLGKLTGTVLKRSRVSPLAFVDVFASAWSMPSIRVTSWYELFYSSDG